MVSGKREEKRVEEALLFIRKHTLSHTHTHTGVAIEVNDNTCGCVGAVTLKHFKYVRLGENWLVN